MKNLSFAFLALLSLSAFAQRAGRPDEIIVDSFMNAYGEHSIHEVKEVDVLSKVEGNRTCLNNEAECAKKYLRDKIIVKVSGMAEANFGGHNTVALDEKSFSEDYNSPKSIIDLKFKGYNRIEDGALVYNNMAWAQWGGSIPFEFKIEVHNDLNKPEQEREFRIPVSDGSIYRFKIAYAKEKWTVEVLSPLSQKSEVSGALAETIFAAAADDESNWAQASFACLKTAGQAPVCFSLGWKTSKPVAAKTSQVIYDLINQALGITSAHYDISVNCQKPTEWNNQTETKCSLSLSK